METITATLTEKSTETVTSSSNPGDNACGDAKDEIRDLKNKVDHLKEREDDLHRQITKLEDDARTDRQTQSLSEQIQKLQDEKVEKLSKACRVDPSIKIENENKNDNGNRHLTARDGTIVTTLPVYPKPTLSVGSPAPLPSSKPSQKPEDPPASSASLQSSSAPLPAASPPSASLVTIPALLTSSHMSSAVAPPSLPTSAAPVQSPPAPAPAPAKRCFQLAASGPAQGTLGQIPDGQIRIGGNSAASTFCMNNGILKDSQGRGCITTPEIGQVQCDWGAAGTPGFSVSGNSLSFNGGPSFSACPVDDFGVFNIYTHPIPGQLKCVSVTINTINSKSRRDEQETKPSVLVEIAEIDRKIASLKKRQRVLAQRKEGVARAMQKRDVAQLPWISGSSPSLGMNVQYASPQGLIGPRGVSAETTFPDWKAVGNYALAFIPNMLMMFFLLLILDRACSAMQSRKRKDVQKEAEQAEKGCA
ncbi:hypothetical protein LTS18_003920 [Coniosporium uncinatum]|uniref:Uncharacterized protein n=1 Tax=Coniosporium uncinatum TaxID=93489 RepID=A0ACC3DBB0_9PEZI|nr:hypothetical protein LTS18_003920 [Coniosporium uncinatum]